VVSSSTVDPNPDDDSAGATLVVTAQQPPVLTPQFAAGNGGVGGFQVSVAGNPGAMVVIQASTNLVNWVNLATNLSPFSFTNLDSTNYLRRFYRAQVVP
jgi:hypothetical protein